MRLSIFVISLGWELGREKLPSTDVFYTAPLNTEPPGPLEVYEATNP